MRSVAPLQPEHEVHEPGHVGQRGGGLGVPLGVGDHVIAAATARVAAPRLHRTPGHTRVHVPLHAHLHVRYGQVPQRQVVAESIQFGCEGSTSSVSLGRQVPAFKMYCAM